MHSVRYGSKVIDYSIHEKEGLKSHYISVEKNIGVVLKGKPVSQDKADKLILKKAKWIFDKLKIVGTTHENDIVTGSRIPYLGKSYYVEIKIIKQCNKVEIDFNHSKFSISLSSKEVTQEDIKTALNDFYKIKAIQKVTSRVERLSAKTKLKYSQLQFRKMRKRWGSCTASNNIIINIDAIKLPYSLIDYLIVHELCHTKFKNHSKAYWAELSKHVPKWKELDEKVKRLKL
jgi:predicted metal-dependent hydrolase